MSDLSGALLSFVVLGKLRGATVGCQQSEIFGKVETGTLLLRILLLLHRGPERVLVLSNLHVRPAF